MLDSTHLRASLGPAPTSTSDPAEPTPKKASFVKPSQAERRQLDETVAKLRGRRSALTADRERESARLTAAREALADGTGSPAAVNEAQLAIAAVDEALGTIAGRLGPLEAMLLQIEAFERAEVDLHRRVRTLVAAAGASRDEVNTMEAARGRCAAVIAKEVGAIVDLQRSLIVRRAKVIADLTAMEDAEAVVAGARGLGVDLAGLCTPWEAGWPSVAQIPLLHPLSGEQYVHTPVAHAGATQAVDYIVASTIQAEARERAAEYEDRMRMQQRAAERERMSGRRPVPPRPGERPGKSAASPALVSESDDSLPPAA